ncbi:hypothetical protein BH09PLA1_BH09PLA1_33580 [soil metagenome]
MDPKSQPDKNPSRTDPASLARMLELDENAWQHDPAEPEMAAMLAHQLAAPIAADLKLTDEQLKQAAQFATVGNLLDHASPPVWLLEEMKQLAKRNRAHGDPSVRQISTMLYYDAIAAALVRCKSRITDLTDDQLRDGFNWAKEQSWIDNKTRQRIESAAASLLGKP